MSSLTRWWVYNRASVAFLEGGKRSGAAEDPVADAAALTTGRIGADHDDTTLDKGNHPRGLSGSGGPGTGVRQADGHRQRIRGVVGPGQLVHAQNHLDHPLDLLLAARP